MCRVEISTSLSETSIEHKASRGGREDALEWLRASENGCASHQVRVYRRPMQDFKHIQAWQRAHALSIAIHRAARGFSRQGLLRFDPS